MPFLPRPRTGLFLLPAMLLAMATHRAAAQAQQAQATMAADPAPAASSVGRFGDWQVDLTAFGWAPSVNGHVTLRGIEAPADARFFQIVQKSSSLFAYMSDVELHNDRFGVFFQPTYIDLGFKSPGGIFRSKVDVSLLYLEAGVFYRVARGAIGDPADGRNWSFDVTAAGRYTRLAASASFANVNLSPSGVQSWGEPLIGVRGSVNVTRDINFAVSGDIGGFGIGSLFAWDAQATLGYDFRLFGRSATVFGGWKALAQDYETGSGRDRFSWATIQNGPVFGLTTRF